MSIKSSNHLTGTLDLKTSKSLNKGLPSNVAEFLKRKQDKNKGLSISYYDSPKMNLKTKTGIVLNENSIDTNRYVNSKSQVAS